MRIAGTPAVEGAAAGERPAARQPASSPGGPLDSERRWAWVFLAPALIGLAILSAGPILATLAISFTDWDLLTPPTWVGLDNFGELMQTPRFWRAMQNTFFYTLLSVPLGMAIALALAMGLDQAIRGIAWIRTMYFLPLVTSAVAVGLVWLWIYAPAGGLLNVLLSTFGIPPQRWVSDPFWAMPAIIVMSVWQGLGVNIIIFLAGLQGIPAHLYEAAKIDGAGTWAQFRKITWPLLSPTTFYVLVIGVINAMQAFSQMHVMTQGGPLGRTTTIVYYLYQLAFENFTMGRASAVACILFVLLLVLTVIQFRVMGSRVHYE